MIIQVLVICKTLGSIHPWAHGGVTQVEKKINTTYFLNYFKLNPMPFLKAKNGGLFCLHNFSYGIEFLRNESVNSEFKHTHTTESRLP